MRAGRQFVGADKNRAERPGIVEILADRPLRRAELKVADRSVAEDRIAADMREPAARGSSGALPITATNSPS
jgi:hypothetical protein